MPLLEWLRDILSVAGQESESSPISDARKHERGRECLVWNDLRRLPLMGSDSISVKPDAIVRDCGNGLATIDRNTRRRFHWAAGKVTRVIDPEIPPTLGVGSHTSEIDAIARRAWSPVAGMADRNEGHQGYAGRGRESWRSDLHDALRFRILGAAHKRGTTISCIVAAQRGARLSGAAARSMALPS
jgi:hypothetical protein